MANINELKELLLGIGVEAEVVNTVTPTAALSQSNFDSLDWPAFIVAVETRYGVKISDIDSLRLKTLNDFIQFIEAEA